MGHGLSTVKAENYTCRTGCQLYQWPDWARGCGLYGCSKEISEINCAVSEEKDGKKIHYGGFINTCWNDLKHEKEFDITYDEFCKAVTSCNSLVDEHGQKLCEYPIPTSDQHYYFMKYARKLGKITSKQEAAMALAQILHESDGLKTKVEYGWTGKKRDYMDANCDYSGKFYYGRGYIQLTWCQNYREASNALFQDDRLVNDPDLVARDEKIAWKTTFWYWGNMVHDVCGVRQGMFGVTTRCINGWLECDNKEGGKKSQIPKKRFQLYQTVRKAFNIDEKEYGKANSYGCYF